MKYSSNNATIQTHDGRRVPLLLSSGFASTAQEQWHARRACRPGSFRGRCLSRSVHRFSSTLLFLTLRPDASEFGPDLQVIVENALPCGSPLNDRPTLRYPSIRIRNPQSAIRRGATGSSPASARQRRATHWRSSRQCHPAGHNRSFPRAALRGCRRFALPWAGVLKPLRGKCVERTATGVDLSLLTA